MKAYLIFYTYKVLEPAFGYFKLNKNTEKGSLLYACDELDKKAVQEIQEILSARHLSYYITHVRRVPDIDIISDSSLEIPIDVYPADTTAKVLTLMEELNKSLVKLKEENNNKEDKKE